MLIDSIQNGIVIDHITAGKAMELYQILGLDKLACTVAILKNVTSGKLGRKDIIKIDGEMELDWDLIGYVDPSITVNIIRGGELQEKRTLSCPSASAACCGARIRAASPRPSASCRRSSCSRIGSGASTAACTARPRRENDPPANLKNQAARPKPDAPLVLAVRQAAGCLWSSGSARGRR